MNNLWVVNPETDNVIVDAKNYLEAVDKAYASHKVEIDVIVPHHKFFVHNAMAGVLLDMANNEANGKRKKPQWEIRIHDINSNLSHVWKSPLCNPKAAILDVLAYYVDMFKYDTSYSFDPNSFFIERVHRTEDAKNEFQYQLLDLIDCLATVKSLYEGIEKNYETFEKEGQFKATK